MTECEIMAWCSRNYVSGACEELFYITNFALSSWGGWIVGFEW